MSIIWNSGFKRKVETIFPPIEIPPLLPLEVKEEEKTPALPEESIEEFKGFGR